MEGHTGDGAGRLYPWMGSSRYKRCAALSFGEFVDRHRAFRWSIDFSIFFFISCLLQAFKIERT
jgi:hypothetical protein